MQKLENILVLFKFILFFKFVIFKNIYRSKKLNKNFFSFSFFLCKPFLYNLKFIPVLELKYRNFTNLFNISNDYFFYKKNLKNRLRIYFKLKKKERGMRVFNKRFISQLFFKPTSCNFFLNFFFRKNSFNQFIRYFFK
jgi:hypothetical protein